MKFLIATAMITGLFLEADSYAGDPCPYPQERIYEKGRFHEAALGQVEALNSNKCAFRKDQGGSGNAYVTECHLSGEKKANYYYIACK